MTPIEARNVQINSLESGRLRILERLNQVERQLSNCRESQRRIALLEEKDLILQNLREQKVRIQEAKRTLYDTQELDSPITDHALVRWLERKHGVDIHKLKSSILNDRLVEALRSRQNYWSDGKHVYCMRGGVVTTVISVSEFEGNTA